MIKCVKCKKVIKVKSKIKLPKHIGVICEECCPIPDELKDLDTFGDYLND